MANPLSSPAAEPAVGQPAHPPLRLDPRTHERGLSCVHCGLCLPACPTYVQDGLEADSPRGRIQLMLGLSDGTIQPTATVRHHLDLCLDCRGCETACPSGVVYHELIEETRANLALTAADDAQGRFMRWLFFHVFTKPARLKLALLPARLLQKAGIYGVLRRAGLFKILPEKLRKMEQMLPARGRIWPQALPTRVAAAVGARKNVTVGFFSGCIGSVLFDEVNRKGVDLLAASGADVLALPAQTCCGAIHLHSGAFHPAEFLARRNIDAFLPSTNAADGSRAGVDYIVTTVAGCGAMLREYDVLLRDDPAYASRAKEFAARVRDITEVLAELGLPEMKHAVSQTVTYHDACHLAHAQKVTVPPRVLLAKVLGLKIVPLPECDMCCGAAGTYNLTQPEMSTGLAERKLRNIASTGAETCVMGNVGCAMQIESEAAARGQKLQVVHTVEILHQAVFGD